MNPKVKEIQKMIENIEWHIETNRNVLGDKRTLDDVHKSLSNLISYIKRVQES